MNEILYTAEATVTGGREGHGRTSDGRLDVDLDVPSGLGGTGGPGTNPEQLFAVGWSACFEGAIAHLARQRRIKLPADPEIDAEVDLNMADDGFFLRARLNVSLPGLEREVAQSIVDEAHQTCPYSKAVRGNIDVAVNLI